MTDTAERPLRRQSMPDHIRELLHRNLQEVFGEGDAARRRAAIEDLYTCLLYTSDAADE